LPGAQIYEDENCTLEATQLLFPAGVSTRLLYFRAAQAGGGDLEAAAAGLVGTTLTVSAAP
jgi:hypothetical protein